MPTLLKPNSNRWINQMTEIKRKILNKHTISIARQASLHPIVMQQLAMVEADYIQLMSKSTHEA